MHPQDKKYFDLAKKNENIMEDISLKTQNENRIDIKKLLGLFAANGSIHQLTNPEKRELLAKLCNSLGLNQYIMPFRIYRDMQGHEFIYATKECCAELRHLHHINILTESHSIIDGMCIASVSGNNKYGRVDSEIGAIHIDSLVGQDKANGVMWAMTKAKRRLTLSLAGLGVLADVETRDMKEVIEYNVLEEKPKALNVATSNSITNALSNLKIGNR